MWSSSHNFTLNVTPHAAIMDFGAFSGGVDDATELDRSLYGMQDAERQRYASFFGTLEQAAPQLVSKHTATSFFAKSSLSDAEVEALYAAVKSAGVVADASLMNETEFVMGMHLIVCMTKRGLSRLPSRFPTHLFPTLQLTLAPTASNSGLGAMSTSHGDLISSMPSPDKPSNTQESGSQSTRASFSSTTPMTLATPIAMEIAKLEDSSSVAELAQREIQNNRLMASRLMSVEKSEVNTLQTLHATVESLAAAVERLGFPVPANAHASIGSLDDLGNLLRKSVQSMRQEIQGLEIEAQMRSVADEATSRTNSNNGNPQQDAQPSDEFARLAQLTQELEALQYESAQLHEKKEALARKLLEKKSTVNVSPATATTSVKQTSRISSASTISSSVTSEVKELANWGDFGGTNASPEISASIEATQSGVPTAETSFTTASFDAFGFGTPSPSPPPPPASSQTKDDDFGWGAFQ